MASYFDFSNAPTGHMFHKFMTQNDRVLGKFKYELVKKIPIRDANGKKIRDKNYKIKTVAKWYEMKEHIGIKPKVYDHIGECWDRETDTVIRFSKKTNKGVSK